MPEPLKQEEVDALLSLAQGSEGGAAPGTAVATEVPSPPPGDRGVEKYNALPSHQISIYDFKRPERVSKSQVVALEALHEVFARNLSASLSGYLRTIVEVRLISVEQFTYSEFTMSLPIPTSFNLLSCEPLEGNVILEVNPSILYPIIDRLLGGGKSDSPFHERPFTNIELSIVNTILERVISQLRETWESVKGIDFQLFETESNPFLLQIVAPNEPIVLLSFELTMGDFTGMVNLCIPFKVIEPIMTEFSQSNWFSSKGPREGGRSRERILGNIANAEIEFSAVLAETPLSLYDLLQLQPGYVIDTGRSTDEPITIAIQGRRKYRGTPYLRKDRRVVQLLDRVQPNDPDA